MIGKTAFFALALVPTAIAQGAPVVINEFLYDNLGGDAIEFVELYNRSTVTVDISNWVLDSEDPSGPNTAYTISAGAVLAPGGRWTIGADAANPGNIDQVVGTTNLWENSNESLTLRDTNGRIVDTLVYESVRGIWDPILAEGPAGVRAQFVTPVADAYSFQRCPDGNDTDDNARDFVTLPFTPAAANFTTNLLPLQSHFVGTTPGDPVPEFRGSFVDPSVIDPVTVGPLLGSNNLNPTAIPYSPTGNNCMISWDPSGGGNAGYFKSRCVGDVLIQACVYVDAALAPTGEGETWNIGRGTVGAFGHHTDPTGTFYALIGGTWLPGNTGVAVCWQRSETYNKVFLVDYGDGTTTTVLGTIDIVGGVSDGWQQMRLTVTGNQAELRWGQQILSGTVQGPDSGGIYIGYREFRVDNTAARAPTLDDLLINGTTADTEPFGIGCPQNAPLTLDALGASLPRIGSMFDMELTNIPASSTLGFMSLGFYTMNPPLDLSSLGMPGCTQYIRPLSSDAFVPAGPTTTLSLMIPNKATLVGLAAYSQAAVLAPGVNLGGLIVSNGGVIRLGM